MDEIKNNPFLSAYTAILVIGAGILGFFAFKSYSGYKEANQAYESVKRSVDGLESQPFYPNDKNKADRAGEVEGFTQQVVKLESELQPYQPERTEGLTVPDLQQRIRKYIEEVRENASLAGVTIVNSDAFRLGMAEPLTIPPRAAAVPGLEFQLIAAHQLANLLIASEVDSIDEMGRKALPIEKPPVIVDPKKKKKSRNRNKKVDVKEPLMKEGEVIERYPLTAIVSGDMASMRNVLNNLASTPPGAVFFSTRYLRVENANKEGPEKESAQKATETIEGEEVEDGVSVILGNEAIKMAIAVDAIRFVSREEVAAAKKAAKNAGKKTKPDA